jgi:peptide/nickel transport system permease protein
MLSVYTYKSNWWGFIAKRVLIALVAFFVISFAILFTISYPFHDIKFNPSEHIAIDPPLYILVGVQLGYNDPYIKQYFRWLGDFFTGEWGHSYIHKVQVKDLVF